MKTLIVFATKHGTTREVAERIAARIEGAAIHDLKKDGSPPLDSYDCVIIGSSLYAGAIRREAKAFMAKSTNALHGKKVGLFLCGMEASGAQGFFNANFPKEILQIAKTTAFTGGIFDPQKASAFERLVIKIVTKKSVYVNTINDSTIDQFAAAMKA